jgi:hypothetical protein
METNTVQVNIFMNAITVEYPIIVTSMKQPAKPLEVKKMKIQAAGIGQRFGAQILF